MLLINFQRQLMVGSLIVRRTSRSFLATSSNIKTEKDYEIDLISLKKIPKKAESFSKVDTTIKKLTFAMDHLNSLDPSVVMKSIDDVKKDPLEYQSYPESDSKGYMDFIVRYQNELKSFLSFIKSSYRNFRGFEQLTSKQIFTAIDLFRRMHLNEKLDVINKYNNRSYDYMFKSLVKLLKQDPKYSQFLGQNIELNFENNKVLIDLYKHGISKYYQELQSLSRKFDFSRLSIPELSNAIGQTIDQFENMIKQGNIIIDETFFKGYIQIQRYRNLKIIFDTLPVNIEHLEFILINSDARRVAANINEVFANENNLDNFISHKKKELTFLFHISPESFRSFYKLLEYLYANVAKDECSFVAQVSKSVWHELIPLVVDRTVEPFQFEQLKLDTIKHLYAFGSPKADFEISVLYSFGLDKYASHLRVLKRFSGKNYQDMSYKDLGELISDFINSFEGSDYIKTSFQRFGEALNEMSQKTLVETSIFDRVLYNYQILEQGELVSSYPSTNQTPLDISWALKSDRKYFQIPETSTIFNYVKELRLFRERVLGGYDYNLFSSSFLLELIDNELYSSSELSNPYFIALRSNLTELFSRNGNQTNILDVLIHNREVFDEMERNLESTKRYTPIPDDSDLYSYSEELKLFREKDLGEKFACFSASEILTLLDKRIKAVSGNKKNTSNSSVGEDNVYKFTRLKFILQKILGANGGFTPILDTLLQSEEQFRLFENSKKKTYKQIPEDFRLDQYFYELVELKLEMGVSKFSSSSAQGILMKLRALSMDHKKFNLEKRKNFSKLYKNLQFLFDYNNDATSVLDNVMISLEVFSNFEVNSEAKRPATKVKEEMPSKAESKSEVENKNLYKQKISVPFPDSSNKFNIDEFKNDPHRGGLKSKLNLNSKYQEALNLKNNENIDSDNISKDKDTETFEAIRSPEDGETKKFNSGLGYSSSTRQIGDYEGIDKETLAKFLRAAKEEEIFDKECKFREEKAYEWSKEMYNSNRSLESKNFFDPIVAASTVKETNTKSVKLRSEYLLMTLNGDTVISGSNPFSAMNQKDDAYELLNRLPYSSSKKILRRIKRLQRKGWKLIGCVGDSSILVFSRIQGVRNFRWKAALKRLVKATLLFFGVFAILGTINREDKEANLDYPILKTNSTKSLNASKESQDNPKTDSPKASWKSLFWKI